MRHTLGDVWAPRIRDCMCCDLLLEPICRPNMLYDLPRSLHSKQFLTAHVQTYRSISSDEYNKKYSVHIHVEVLCCTYTETKNITAI